MPQEELQAVRLDEETIDDVLYAARAGDLEFLNEILANPPADVSTAQLVISCKDPNSGNTPIHFSAANGHLEVLKKLIAQAKDNAHHVAQLVTSTNQAGSTPLHYAAINGQLEAVKDLVNALPSADQSKERMEYMQAKNEAGHDAAFEAEVADKENVVNWLLGEMDALEPIEAPEEDAGADESNADAIAASREPAATNGIEEDVEKVNLSG